MTGITTERDRRNQFRYELEQEVAKAKAEGRESGLAEGRAEGREEGKAEGIEQTARTMLSLGYPIEDISKITGLSIESLKNLK